MTKSIQNKQYKIFSVYTSLYINKFIMIIIIQNKYFFSEKIYITLGINVKL